MCEGFETARKGSACKGLKQYNRVVDQVSMCHLNRLSCPFFALMSSSSSLNVEASLAGKTSGRVLSSLSLIHQGHHIVRQAVIV